MLPWQERTLLCQMFATCSYPVKAFGARFWAIFFYIAELYSQFSVQNSHLVTIANFVLKFPNFRRHGNKGRSAVNFCDTDKLYDIDNPLIGATYLALCLILPELWLILC